MNLKHSQTPLEYYEKDTQKLNTHIQHNELFAEGIAMHHGIQHPKEHFIVGILKSI